MHRHSYMFNRITCRNLVSAAIAAASMSLGGCLSLPTGVSQVAPMRYERAPVPVSRARADLIRITARQIGTPYRYGGSSRRGFDCSGLVQYVHRAVGIDVPRTATEQWRYAATPQRRHLIPGDLVFFAINGKKTSHVGVYEGGGHFIHAPSSGKRVSRASLDNPYWRKRMVGARSFL